MDQSALERTKSQFFILLALDALLTTVIGLHDFGTIGVFQALQRGELAATPELVHSLETWEQFSKGLVLTLVAVGVGLVRWLRACYEFARVELGATGFTQEKWAVAGWIFPFLNLFKPYQVVNEIYKAGGSDYRVPEGWKTERGSALLLTWWIFWAVTHFIASILGKQLFLESSREDISLQQGMNLLEAHAAICLMSVVVAGLWFIVAESLTARLLRRRSAQPNSAVAVNTAASVDVPARSTSPSLTARVAERRPADLPSVETVTARNNTTNSVVGERPKTEPRVEPSATFQGGNVTAEQLEERAYELVTIELESGKPKKALWTKAFVESNGDETQQKLIYIKRRVPELIEEERRRLLALDEEQARATAAALEREQAVRDSAARRQHAWKLMEPYWNKVAFDQFYDHDLLAAGQLASCISRLSTAPRVAINVQNGFGRTLLHMAAILGDRVACETLIAYRADLSILDAAGNSAGDLATKAGHDVLAKSLTATY